MNKKDVLWQTLVDEEKLRFSSLPVEKLLSMEPFTPNIIQSNGMRIKCGIWHEVRTEDIPFTSEETHSLSSQLDRDFGIRRPQREIHSFVLKASRTLFLGFYRNYTAGFSLNEAGRIIPISEEILGNYD